MKTVTPVELNMAIKFISDLLQTMSKFLVVWITQLPTTKLGSGNSCCLRVISMPLKPIVDETTKTDS